MNLAIDAGNSSIKYGVFDSEKLIKQGKATYDNWNNELEKTKKEYRIQEAIISLVGKTNILESLSFTKYLLKLNSQVKTPLTNKYETPNSLGMDRLAAAVGAHSIYPKQNILVIDIGTAITYEFISAKGEYLGGNISPGLQLRFKALHEFTGKLPLVRPSEKISLIGKNTNDAILNGVICGIIKEIEGIIKDFEKKTGGMKTILTGGDCIFFDKTLKNFIFVEPNLVLLGLNRILLYNAEGNR